MAVKRGEEQPLAKKHAECEQQKEPVAEFAGEQGAMKMNDAGTEKMPAQAMPKRLGPKTNTKNNARIATAFVTSRGLIVRTGAGVNLKAQIPNPIAPRS